MDAAFWKDLKIFNHPRREGREPALVTQPPGQRCEETNGMIGDRYLRCGAFPVALVASGDERLYYMCEMCTAHNVRNRGAIVVGRIA